MISVLRHSFPASPSREHWFSSLCMLTEASSAAVKLRPQRKALLTEERRNSSLWATSCSLHTLFPGPRLGHSAGVIASKLSSEMACWALPSLRGSKHYLIDFLLPDGVECKKNGTFKNGNTITSLAYEIQCLYVRQCSRGKCKMVLSGRKASILNYLTVTFTSFTQNSIVSASITPF